MTRKEWEAEVIAAQTQYTFSLQRQDAAEKEASEARAAVRASEGKLRLLARLEVEP